MLCREARARTKQQEKALYRVCKSFRVTFMRYKYEYRHLQKSEP